MANPTCPNCNNETKVFMEYDKQAYHAVGDGTDLPKMTGVAYWCQPCKIYYDQQGAEIARGKS